MKKISVITINYNEARLEQTCNSIAEQSYSCFEWVVIDGGSTAENLSIFDRYKSRITHFVSEKDSGIYNAMNKGIKLATGEFLIFMNAGDTFESKYTLEKVVTYMEGKQGDIFYGDAIFVMKNGDIRYKCLPKKLSKTFFAHDCIAHQAAYIRKTLFEKFGLYDESYKIASDWERWISFLLNGAQYKHLPFLCARHCYDGVSACAGEKVRQERAKVLKNYDITLSPNYRHKQLFSVSGALEPLILPEKPELVNSGKISDTEADIDVSVIIPVCNVQDYLPRCLDSIIQEKQVKLEIICIDDCSSDLSSQIIKNYCTKDDRISYYRFNKNVGVSRARNCGLQNARGKYVVFVDSDDYLSNGFLYQLYQKITQDSADITKANVTIIRNNKPETSQIHDKVKQAVKNNEFIGQYWQHEFWSCMYRREFLTQNKIEFRVLRNGEDILFILDCLSHSPVLTFCDDVEYVYCIRESSASHKLSLSRALNIIEHFSESLDIVNSLNISEDARLQYFQSNIITNIVNYWWPHQFTKQLNEEELEVIRQKISYLVADMGCLDELMKRFEPYYAERKGMLQDMIFNFPNPPAGSTPSPDAPVNPLPQDVPVVQKKRFLGIIPYVVEKTEKKEVCRFLGMPVLKKRRTHTNKVRCYLFGIQFGTIKRKARKKEHVNIKDILNFFKNFLSWLYTVYFNFHYLPFSQAKVLPIFLHKPKFTGKLAGKVRIEGPVSKGMIRLGFHYVGIYPDEGIIWGNDGEVVFKGQCIIGSGSAISVGRSGLLEIGADTTNYVGLKVVCFHHIDIQGPSRLGWEVFLMDTAFHRTKYLDGSFTGNGVAPIVLGAHTWVCTRCMVMPGGGTAPYTIVAANSLLNKRYDESRVMLAGQPASIRKRGIWRDFADDSVDFIGNSIVK